MITKLTAKTILDENYCICMMRNATTVFVFWKFSDYYLKLFEEKIISQEVRIKVFNEEGKCIADIPSIYASGGLHIILPSFSKKIRVGIFGFEKGVEKSFCFSNEIDIVCEKEIKKDYSFLK
ncbi:MAG: hypothetical protein N2Z20_02675 [Elusimicrobiales bacterium]|nr:hypothetical protein [Elusimicrobiales bacterium]